LDYENQPGALNEHFADVMGILVRQWRKKQTAAKANWLIGAELLTPAPTRRALRDMAAPGTAYVDDPDLGTDPQPKDMDDFGIIYLTLASSRQSPMISTMGPTTTVAFT
jgi:Zn-dependent metalloprotease